MVMDGKAARWAAVRGGGAVGRSCALAGGTEGVALGVTAGVVDGAGGAAGVAGGVSVALAGAADFGGGAFARIGSTGAWVDCSGAAAFALAETALAAGAA
jgi:hypothetical protein